MNSLRYAALVACMILSSSLQSHAALKQGSFDTTITFMGKSRMLSCYVPTNYADTNKYRLMVCLHGLGDNSQNYRNALITSLAWNTNFPKTIFICPEASTTTADYYETVGSEQIVQKCMDFAMSNYHIDTANIILQGFSLGGRAALRYGLDHYTQFKGLLLNTPAIQGVKNALNDQPTYQYTYANAAHIPIYITHGEADILYEPPIDTALKLMILSDGKVRYNDIPKMGHTIPTYSRMSDAISFFDTAARTGSALEIFELDAPTRTCALPITPTMLVHNIGSDTIREIKFSTNTNSQPNTYTWDGVLLPFQHAIVSLPTLTSLSPSNMFTVQVTTINGVTPVVPSTKSNMIEYDAHGTSLPVVADFESSSTDLPQGWILEQAGDVYSAWSIDSTVAKSGTNSLNAFNTIWIFDNQGRAEGLLSPVMDMTTTSSPQLSFDVSFTYDQYTPPYVKDTVNFTDTLDILISTDCGATFTSVWRKSGADLATFAEPVMNPLSLQADFFTPDDTNWRHYTIDLSHYASATDATIKFNYISGLGGLIWLDNIRIGTALAVNEPVATHDGIYPNPANDHATVIGQPGSIIHVEISDIAGHRVSSTDCVANASGAVMLDTHALATGVYLMRIDSGNAMHFEKLVIDR